MSQSAVRRLPRLALILFCAAYVLPGFLGREPWKTADVAALTTGSIVALTTPTGADGRRPYDGPAEVSYNEGWEKAFKDQELLKVRELFLLCQTIIVILW